MHPLFAAFVYVFRLFSNVAGLDCSQRRANGGPSTNESLEHSLILIHSIGVSTPLSIYNVLCRATAPPERSVGNPDECCCWRVASSLTLYLANFQNLSAARSVFQVPVLGSTKRARERRA